MQRLAYVFSLLAVVTISASSIVLSAPPTSPADSTKTTLGDPAEGKKLFSKKGCFACHKADGSGGLKLTGNPTPDWRDAERMAKPEFGVDYLRDCITNGKPKSGMVSWKRQLKPEQVDDLIAYIHTFSQKTKKTKKTKKTQTSKKAAKDEQSGS